MPSGAAVQIVDGKRTGAVFYVKFRDATGRQVKERLGSAREGWTDRKARAALRRRLVDVERDGYKKPVVATFETTARAWLATYPDVKGLKRSTRRSYANIVANHLVPAFGSKRLEQIDAEAIERFIAAQRKKGLSAASVNRELNVLSLIFRGALRRQEVRVNPVGLVDRPREDRRRWRILTPQEAVRVEAAFDALIAEAEDERELTDRRTARVMFLTFLGTGIRFGEALGLHWRVVHLADPDGPYMRIEETYVRDAADTPKSVAGNRTISLGARLAAELFDHRARTTFRGDDERVFANPRTGHVFEADVYADVFRAALVRAGITDYMRPAHDLRHSSITNAAAAGTPPEALMTRAGHSSYATTKLYVDLAGERFRDEAERLERRLWGTGRPVSGSSGTKSRYKDTLDATDAAAQPVE
jgi:integrase